jgi:MFS family permease
MALGGVVMGRLADRTTTRRVSLIGAIVLGLSLMLAAWADSLWEFYVLFFVAGFFGAGALFTPLIANLGSWFTKGAGLALGIASAGQALGQGGVPFGTAILIGAMGWREALTTLGLITLAALVPLAMLIRQPPKYANPQRTKLAADLTIDLAADQAGVDGAEREEVSPVPLPPRVVVTWLSVAVIFCCTCMSVPLMHVVPLIQDRGISLEDAGSVVLVMMIAGIAGRLVFGKLADVIGPIQAYMLASFWQTALVFLFIQLETLEAFYLFAAVYGFGYAGVMTGIIVCVHAMTPLSRRASALGIVVLFCWVGHGIGGYQGGYFFDLTGDYTLSYGNAALAGVVNLIIMTTLYLTIARRRAALAFAG